MAEEVDRRLPAQGRGLSILVIVTALVLPLLTYALTYGCCCHRRVIGEHEQRLSERWLLVRTPSGTSGLFFPAACVEAAVRGCWFGVVARDAEWFRWELVFVSGRFFRGHRPPPRW